MSVTDVDIPDVETLTIPSGDALLKQLDEWLDISKDRTMFSCTEIQNFLLDTRAYIRFTSPEVFEKAAPAPLPLPEPPVEDENDGFDPRSLLG